jgi:ribokinase
MKSARFDIVVVGGINSDYLIRGAKLPQPGETVDGEQFFHGPGGKGANQAVAAARLGARAALVARIGRDDRGNEMLAGLKREGVDTRFVVRDAKESTGAAVIMVDAQAEKQILSAPGANRRLTVRDVQRALSQAMARVVLMQFEVPLATVTATARLARKLGAQVLLDPAPPVELPSDALLRFVDVIRPNSSEAEALTGIQVSNQASARRAAAKLIQRGVRAVAMQAGDDGNLLVWHGGTQLLPKLPVKSVDATGAGDAFIAALAVGIAEGRAFIEAGWMANGAAALATTKLGAQTALPRRKELSKLLKRFASDVKLS